MMEDQKPDPSSAPAVESGEEDNPFNKPDACRACTLFTEPGIVQGWGNRNAKLFYLGEAPGAEEVDAPRHRPERMRPFIGGAGRVRNAILRDASLDKEAIFTTNCVKCRPPNNRLPSDYEITCCARFLIEEIEDVNPNVIVAAGETAFKTLTSKKGISLWRGVPTEGPRLRSAGSDSTLPGSNGEQLPYKVFGTWHPSFVMRVQWNWAFAVHDMVRAKAESAFPEIIRVPIVVNRTASPEADLERLGRDIRERHRFTFDFETTGLHAGSSAIQLCGFVGRPDQGDVFAWTDRVRQFLEELLADPTIEVCGQNILTFDLPYAEDKGVRVSYERVFDTMVAFYLCNSTYGQTPIAEQNAGTYRTRGTEKDLSFIASNHTDIEYWKSRDNYKNDLRSVCGLDCIATDRSAYHERDGLRRELASYGMDDLYWKRVLPVHPILHRMHKRGFKINEELAFQWKMMLHQTAEEKEKVLKEGLGDPFLNLNSPKQLMDILYNKLGLPVQYVQDKKKGLRPTANADAIEHLASLHPDNAILMEIVTIRHLTKMESTYIDPGLETGWLHPHFGVAKAANGRFNGWDPNAQNVPEEMRDIWIPDDPDHVVLSADSSQIEWRNAMALSGDPVGLELLASGVDNHRAVYSETHGVPISDVTDAQRHAAKFIVYGLGYGRGAQSIAEGHGLDLRFVEEFIARFFRRFSVFKEWRDHLVDEVRRTNYLRNPWARRRWWYTRNITEIYNYPASSCAADMMIDELLALDPQLPKGATIRLTVHDEIVCIAHKDVVRDAWLCMKTVMQQPWPQMVEASARPENVKKYFPNGFYVPVDIHVGTNWKMCKSKDPEDKRERAILEKHLGLS